MKNKSPFVSVVITAGGTGKRFSEKEDGLPKQFRPLCGVSILQRTVSAFEKMNAVDEIVLSLPRDFVDGFKCESNKIRAAVPGGSDRQASVYAALQAVSKEADIVLIHDGVRPFIKEETVNRVIACVSGGFAAIAGVKATDTVKQTDSGGCVTGTPDRNGLWMVQTPQGFTYETIMKAHEMARDEGFTGTDDGMLVERYALAAVKMVEGGRENIKITTKFDMVVAKAYIEGCYENGHHLH